MNILLSIFFFFFLFSCSGEDSNSPQSQNYREMMRDFVKQISNYTKTKKQDFIIITQNGIELLIENSTDQNITRYDYLDAVDGISQEGLFYGYEEFNQETQEEITTYLLSILIQAKRNNKPVLITDYCKDVDKINLSYQKNKRFGFISFQADSLELDQIPKYPEKPWEENYDNIQNLSDGKNYLYLLNFRKFSSKEDLIDKLNSTNYDILIIDAFWREFEMFSKEDIQNLKTKQNGGKRLVIAYLSIGEAENYRYYWKDEWNYQLPDWIKDYQEWEGNFPVEFWNGTWQEIIYDYLDKIVTAGFDGVFLDKVDIFEFFEGNYSL
ncbi:MAG: hypothetical protein GXO22_00250 [Aquificae bacterium]|nr:hypothetical protein [Aquificota bacterium]